MNTTTQREELSRLRNANIPVANPGLGRLRCHILRLCILCIASYGLFYFTYKFNRPWASSNDFYHNYYYMDLSPLNPNAAPAPFILRQVSAVITHLVLATHIFVPNRMAYPVPGYNPRVLFAAMITNWVFLLLAAWLAGIIAEDELKERNGVVALIAGFLCLLAFQTPFFVLSGLTEGVSWFLMAAGFLAYIRRASRWLLLVLVISVVQRESISIILGVIAAVDLLVNQTDRRFKAQALAEALLCFCAYFMARRFGFHGNDSQTHLAGIMTSLRSFGLTRTLLDQMVLTQSTAILFFAFALVGERGTQIRRLWVPCLLSALIVMDALGVAADIVDIGRILAILVPILAALAAAAMWQQRHRLE